VAVGVNNEISEISLNVAASALLAFEKKAVLQKYSSKEIYLEALRRFKKFIIE
jgi:hypothetical protein